MDANDGCPACRRSPCECSSMPDCVFQAALEDTNRQYGAMLERLAEGEQGQKTEER